jgi:shikimate kinase
VAVVLYGPKGAGKSFLARRLAEVGVFHVDPDPLIHGLLAAGRAPDPVEGWLRDVLRECFSALQRESIISVEATGAYESDWRLRDELGRNGHRVVRVWVYARLDVTLERLSERTGRAPLTRQQAETMYELATARAETVDFDFVIDTTSDTDADEVETRLAAALEEPTPDQYEER